MYNRKILLSCRSSFCHMSSNCPWSACLSSASNNSFAELALTTSTLGRRFCLARLSQPVFCWLKLLSVKLRLILPPRMFTDVLCLQIRTEPIRQHIPIRTFKDNACPMPITLNYFASYKQVCAFIAHYINSHPQNWGQGTQCWPSWTLVCTPGWPWTQKSTCLCFQLLGLKACTAILSKNYLLKQLVFETNTNRIYHKTARKPEFLPKQRWLYWSTLFLNSFHKFHLLISILWKNLHLL